MSNAHKLLLIKLLHTVIWALFITTIFYIICSSLANQLTIYTWVAIGTGVAEGLVLALCNQYCPLTVLARQYSDSQKDDFDIWVLLNK